MTYLVIRAGSDRGVTKKIKDTMMMLNLTRVNHATLVPENVTYLCLLYTSPSPRDQRGSRMPSSA